MKQNNQISRIKNAKKNMFTGVINKVLSLVLPFVLRTVMIQTIGIEYLGLSSLFTSILQLLNVSELGINASIICCMYQPIAENNIDKVCALVNFYRKTYRIIGVFFLSMGLLILPFVENFINGSYPNDINIYIIYFLYLLNASVSYFFFSYRAAILTAHQKLNITNNVHSVIYILVSIFQIIAMFMLKNYYVYVILLIITTVLNNVVAAYYSKKYYPQYICKGKLDKETFDRIKMQILGLMINKVCYLSRNSFDAIYLSMFLGLTVSAIYGNYYLIMTGISSLLGIITTSATAGVGSSIALQTPEKNYFDMKKFDFLYMLISGWTSICLLCLYQPFMIMWIGEEYLFSIEIVILFVIYFYGLALGNVRYMYTSGSGLWWQGRYRSILEAILNICLNYILGKKFGVVGIIIATLITLIFINQIYGSSIIFKYYFKNGKWYEYIKYHILYVFVTSVVAMVTYFVCSAISYEGILGLMIRLLICIIVPIILYSLMYCKNQEARRGMQWIKYSLLNK